MYRRPVFLLPVSNIDKMKCALLLGSLLLLSIFPINKTKYELSGVDNVNTDELINELIFREKCDLYKLYKLVLSDVLVLGLEFTYEDLEIILYEQFIFNSVHIVDYQIDKDFLRNRVSKGNEFFPYWLNKNKCHYDKFNIRNTFMGRMNTNIVVENIFSRILGPIKPVVSVVSVISDSVISDSSKVLLNSFLKSSFQIRINYTFLANYLSKPKYSLPKIVASVQKPKTYLLIILLLLMSGDTGVSINPGPNIECSYCEAEITYNNRYLSCQECNIRVHLECNHYSESSHFLCNMCSFEFLPFSQHNDSICLDDNMHTMNYNEGDNDMNSNAINYNNVGWGHFKNKGLHFLHINARSLFHKVSEINKISKRTNAAVIAVSETWLDDSYPDDSVKIEGYNLIRRDRLGHAGGVSAYIRGDLAYNTRTDLNNVETEDLWFEILLPKSKPLYIGVFYRTNENIKFLESFKSTLSKLRPECDLIVLGDFNICLLKNKSKLSREYKQLLTSFGCKQIIDKPTRITEHSLSLLDHIIINNPQKIYQSGVLNVGLSDHLMVYCSRKATRGHIGKHNTVKIRSLKNYSIHEFLNKLRNVNWENVTSCIDVNVAWNNFKTLYMKILDEVAPIKYIRIKTRTESWMSSTILELIYERDKVLSRLNKNRENEELREQFNRLRNKVQHKTRTAKANYFKDKIEQSQGNSKQIWKHLKSIGYKMKAQNNSKIVLDIDNELSFDPKNIADHSNNFFKCYGHIELW